MEAPREKVLQNVSEWLARADEDLQLATYALTMHAPPYRLIAYHAQQCAEKCLKAFLVFHNIDFPFTHNIGRLLVLCGDHASWGHALEDADELTAYGITTRYPGEDRIVTKEEAEGAIDAAQRVRTQVRVALRGLGMELP